MKKFKVKTRKVLYTAEVEVVEAEDDIEAMDKVEEMALDYSGIVDSEIEFLCVLPKR